MRRAIRWTAAVAVATVAAALVTHEVLLHLITRSGSEAVGVALGPGTPWGDVALMGAFVAVRVGLILVAPGVVAAVVAGLVARRGG